MRTQSLASWLLLSIPAAVAHTWIEEMIVVAPNGSFVGEPGYPRGYKNRLQPGFEDYMVYLLPPNGRPTGNAILPSDTICKSTQMIGSQTAEGPALVASPGDNIALLYQENGHVTLPNTQIGKPPNRGTVYIYGTTKPSNDDKLLSIHKVWNAAGTGGDGRGVLLATRNFDDGQCYQDNSGPIATTRKNTFKHAFDPLMGSNNLWCQNDVQLPTDVTASTYTLYWVWDWPTLPNVAGSGDLIGKNETYTTCMDVTLKGQSKAATKAKAASQGFIAGLPLDKAAIKEQLETPFQVPVAQADVPNAASTTVLASSSTTTTTSSTASISTSTFTDIAIVTVTVTATEQVTITVPASTTTIVDPNTDGKPSISPFFQTTATATSTSMFPYGTGTAAKKVQRYMPRHANVQVQ